MKTSSSLRHSLLAAAFLLAPSHWLLAQGSLTPPGAPAPTMKSLAQIEPATPMDATHTPGDATSVFRITAPGSYYLTAPLTGDAGKAGIAIDASNVTVDLRGFPLTGVPGSAEGVLIAYPSSNVTVRNGTITAWGTAGVKEATGVEAGTYEALNVIANGADGLQLGPNATVKACTLSDNLGYGVNVDGRALISDSTAHNNGDAGFYFASGSVLGSVASSNDGAGFEIFDEPSLMKDCVAFDNTDGGFRATDGAKFADCIARNNGTQGIDAGSYATVTDCTVKNNGWGIFAGTSCRIIGNMCEGNGHGIYTYGNQNLIDRNQTINGGNGITCFTGSVDNLIIRNAAGDNALNYSIVPDNRYGPIIDITGTATPAVSGNSAADTTTTTHPWANFAYAPGPAS